jgi:hypothetical protein
MVTSSRKIVSTVHIKSSSGSTRRQRQQSRPVLTQPTNLPKSLLLMMMKLALVDPRKRIPLSRR